ncbi:hypothetical protein M885DRAFT_564216 [Pelagophyceae sp. CCMP2097]|nr:hypothetical protein M885DRAFT_564216 [Pelagophyceae sp. CCMP2097]
MPPRARAGRGAARRPAASHLDPQHPSLQNNWLMLMSPILQVGLYSILVYWLSQRAPLLWTLTKYAIVLPRAALVVFVDCSSARLSETFFAVAFGLLLLGVGNKFRAIVFMVQLFVDIHLVPGMPPLDVLRVGFHAAVLCHLFA